MRIKSSSHGLSFDHNERFTMYIYASNSNIIFTNACIHFWEYKCKNQWIYTHFSAQYTHTKAFLYAKNWMEKKPQFTQNSIFHFKLSSHLDLKSYLKREANVLLFFVIFPSAKISWNFSYGGSLSRVPYAAKDGFDRSILLATRCKSSFCILPVKYNCKCDMVYQFWYIHATNISEIADFLSYCRNTVFLRIIYTPLESRSLVYFRYFARPIKQYDINT